MATHSSVLAIYRQNEKSSQVVRGGRWFTIEVGLLNEVKMSGIGVCLFVCFSIFAKGKIITTLSLTYLYISCLRSISIVALSNSLNLYELQCVLGSDNCFKTLLFKSTYH